MVNPKDVLIKYVDKEGEHREVSLDNVISEIGWEYGVRDRVLSLRDVLEDSDEHCRSGKGYIEEIRIKRMRKKDGNNR